MQPGWVSVLWFVAIVAMIPVALWLLKRTPLGGAAPGRPGTPRIVAVLPLSAQQKLVTVEIGQGEDRQWLVLGVTPQSIRQLHIAAPVGAADNAAPPATAAFGPLLSRWRSPGPDDHAKT